MARSRSAIAAAFAAGLLAGRLAGAPQLRFARMSGSSIAAPDAAGWITDFLNAAYYRRPPDDRQVDDLRLAFAIVTTRWHRLGHRRLRGADVVPFHRAFGTHRLRARGRLDRRALLDGASRLHGDWFPAAYADDARRGWGIAFETPDAKRAYDPETRLRHARLGALTPETAPRERQTWHTYAPVAVAPDALEKLAAPERWPDFASAIGRFTPVRPGGLQDQTFEIEVAAGTAAGRPVFLRGYVTTGLADDVQAYAEALNEGLASHGEPHAVPAGAEPLLGLDLTTHDGHFMGSGHNRLVAYRAAGTTYLRAAGTWDPMPWHLAQAYALAGREAQHAFWGAGDPDLSMLHQL